MSTPASPPTPTPVFAPSVPMSPACIGATPPRTVRRRDGLTLAATGAIPARVRAQVLAEHRAHLAARTRLRIQTRINAGLRPLPIPYGYRRTDSHLATLPALPTRATHRATADPYAIYGTGSRADLPPTLAATTEDRERGGRARPVHWRIDPACAETVWFMTRCARCGIPPARIAAILNTTTVRRPPLLDTTGRPRRWSAHTVRDLLTNPLLTGHSVWGRTRHGRPVPRHEWIVSTTPTHPPLVDAATLDAITEALTTTPITAPTVRPARPVEACSTRPQARR